MIVIENKKMESQSSTIRTLKSDFSQTKDPLLRLMDLNADVGAFLGDHWAEAKDQSMRLGEERAKMESQKLMKLVFQYENEFSSVEEDFASRI